MLNKTIIFIFFFLFHNISVLFAQASCSGSLGVPIVNITFGQGANPGAPLNISVPGASTSYIYVAPTGTPPQNIILDGDYSLINQIPPNPGWFGGATDHTGNTNGYMAFFNAAPNPGEFYHQSVNGLCGGTTYEFAAWIINAINPSVIGNAVPPNITFKIFDPANLVTPLTVFNTGDIAATSSPIWHRFSTLFTLPSGLSSVVLTLSNNNVGGTSQIGNDLAIDDITFRACGPLTQASFSSSSSLTSLLLCPNVAFTVYGTVSAGLNIPAYQWQVSSDNGTTWTDITGATSLNYSYAGYASGVYQFRLASQEAANVSSLYCKFFSSAITLTIKPKSFFTNNQIICEGQSYQGHTLTGIYISTLVAANGCDSIYTLNLTVNPKSFSTVNTTICEGQSVSGHTTSGTYTDTYVAANSCDSIRTLNLIVKPKSFFTNNQNICEGQSYQGHTVTGTYVSTLVAANGCDSIYTLNLTVKPKSFTTNNQSICEGQSYQGHTTTGTYVSTLVAANGCDSIYTLNLTVKPKSFYTDDQIICEGQSYQGHTTTGIYVSTLIAANGCDSIYTLNLTVKPKSFSTINTSICEGQNYQGYTNTGTYTDTYVAANGCDSVRTLNLIVKPKSFTIDNQSICEGQSYQGHTVTGTYVNTLVAANGCDSIYTLNLTVRPKSFTTNNQSICEGQSYQGHTATGTYVSTLVAANGCDSIYTLNLTVKPKSFFTDNQSICEGQTYQGHTTTGTYVSTLVAANGCDSIYTLNLTVKPSSFSTINNTICDGQSVAGHTTTGTYIDTYVAANGCDSIRTLNLIVKPRSFTTNNQSICEGQTYQGHTTTGTYVTTLVAANGCDSIYTLNLTVRPKSFTTNNQSICEGQSYQGHTATGTYVTTLVAANGCDSIYTLNLTVKPKSFSTINVGICEGQSYAGYTVPGTYTDTYIATNGCDSIRTLNLTLKPKSFTTDNRAICSGQSYQGHSTAGTYITTFTAANGCDSIYTLNLSIKPLPIVNTIPDTSICNTQTITLTTIGNADSYSWFPVFQLSNPTSASPQFSGMPGHKYFVTGTLNGCANIDSVNVFVRSAALLVQPPDKSFCQGGNVILDGYNGTDVTYLWTGPNINNIHIKNPIANPGGSNVYSVKVTDNLCHYDSTFILYVNMLPLPLIKAQKANDINCLYQNSPLSASGGFTYVWSPVQTLNSVNIPNPIATPDITTTYYVVGTDINGCANTDSITVVKNGGMGHLFIPNTFSPNGDSKNDCFRVLVTDGTVSHYSLLIFDRWGEKKFESHDINDCWNGMYKGKNCMIGNYVYYVTAQLICGSINEKGNLLLIR